METVKEWLEKNFGIHFHKWEYRERPGYSLVTRICVKCGQRSL